jgi:hypothetical protein
MELNVFIHARIKCNLSPFLNKLLINSAVLQLVSATYLTLKLYAFEEL